MPCEEMDNHNEITTKNCTFPGKGNKKRSATHSCLVCRRLMVARVKLESDICCNTFASCCSSNLQTSRVKIYRIVPNGSIAMLQLALGNIEQAHIPVAQTRCLSLGQRLQTSIRKQHHPPRKAHCNCFSQRSTNQAWPHRCASARRTRSRCRGAVDNQPAK